MFLVTSLPSSASFVCSSSSSIAACPAPLAACRPGNQILDEPRDQYVQTVYANLKAVDMSALVEDGQWRTIGPCAWLVHGGTW
jgi:hypothetical protein